MRQKLCTRMVFMALTILVFTLSACNKNSEEEGVIDDGWSDWGQGSTPPTLVSDFSTSDMDNFVELNLKMENLKLQFAKFMSNGWQGDLYAGPGAKSDPTEMYKLLEELLDKKDIYLKAAQNIDNQGILDNTTTGFTRGVISSTYDMIYNGWGSTAKNRRMKILTLLAENHVMGNASAQQELFNSLPSGLKKGETDAKTWFNKLNQGEYDNACPQIHARWVNMGAGESGNAGSALGQYYKAAETAAGGKNPLHLDAYKVGIEQTQKAMNVNVALWDTATGGYLGKWQDADTIMKESYELSKKISDGSATPADIRRWVSGVGTIYAKEKIGELLPDVGDPDYDSDVARILADLTDAGKNEMVDNLTEWMTENGIQSAENDAAANGISLMDIRNNIENSGGSPSVIITKDDNGRLTVSGTDKDGNSIYGTRPGNKTVTTVTRDGKRATQKTNAKAGKNELQAVPNLDGLEWYVEVDPQWLVFDYSIDTKTVVVTTYAKYFSARSKDEWIHVSTNGTNVIVKVDQNDTGESREGSVVIGLSQDKETFPKTVSVSVYQRAEPEALDLASFIDFNNLSIEEIICYADYSQGTGDLHTISINPGALGYGVPFPFENMKVTSFAARELTTRRISDNVYEVSGSKIVPISQDGWTDEEALLSPDEPYGVYYDMSFNIEARDPWALIEENNFAVTNFKAQGYYKWRNVEKRSDMLYRFSLEAGAAGINDETYTKNSCVLEDVYASVNDDSRFWRWDVSFKYFDSWGSFDANENWVYTHSPISQTNKGSTTSNYGTGFAMTLRW